MEMIKKCPCCGNDARIYSVGPKTIISCLRCGIKMEKTYANRQDIIRAWNKRVS